MRTKRLQIVALFGVLGGLGLSGCGEKADYSTAPAGGGDPKEIALKVIPGDSSSTPAGGLEAVARATGFAKFMPDTTHAYIGIYDGRGFVDEVRKSELLKLAEEQLGDNFPNNPDFDLENLDENPQAQMIAALLGEEIFVGVGNGAPGQIANLVAFNEAYVRASTKALVQTGEAFLSGEGPGFDENDPRAALQQSLMPLLSSLIDPKGGLGVLEKAQMPPVTLGFKVSDEEVRGQLFEIVAQGIEAMLEDIGPDGEGFAEPLKVERGGSKFTGLKIKGEEVVASLPPDVKEGMGQFMDAATVDKLMKVLESKDIVLAVGVHESYLVGFMGSSVDDLQIAASPAESLLSRPEAAFMKSFAGKRLVSFVTMSKELQDSSARGASMFGGYATGLKEGLAETDAFGDLQDLEVLLDTAGLGDLVDDLVPVGGDHRSVVEQAVADLLGCAEPNPLVDDFLSAGARNLAQRRGDECLADRVGAVDGDHCAGLRQEHQRFAQ